MFSGETAAGPAAGEHAGSVRGTAGAAAGHPLYSGYRVPAFWQAGAKQVLTMYNINKYYR